MTREEIRNYLKDGLGNVWADGRDGKGVDLDALADNILTYLHSQGVVIRVDRELPENPYELHPYQYDNELWNLASPYDGYEECQQAYKGYVAVESLVCCSTCKKEPCECPSINRGSFAKYVEEG